MRVLNLLMNYMHLNNTNKNELQDNLKARGKINSVIVDQATVIF